MATLPAIGLMSRPSLAETPAPRERLGHPDMIALIRQCPRDLRGGGGRGGDACRTPAMAFETGLRPLLRWRRPRGRHPRVHATWRVNRPGMPHRCPAMTRPLRRRAYRASPDPEAHGTSTSSPRGLPHLYTLIRCADLRASPHKTTRETRVGEFYNRATPKFPRTRLASALSHGGVLRANRSRSYCHHVFLSHETKSTRPNRKLCFRMVICIATLHSAPPAIPRSGSNSL